MYEIENIMEYWHSLNNQDKEIFVYWIAKELSNARARIWLSTVKYSHEIASKASENRRHCK